MTFKEFQNKILDTLKDNNEYLKTAKKNIIFTGNTISTPSINISIYPESFENLEMGGAGYETLAVDILINIAYEKSPAYTMQKAMDIVIRVKKVLMYNICFQKYYGTKPVIFSDNKATNIDKTILMSEYIYKVKLTEELEDE